MDLTSKPKFEDIKGREFRPAFDFAKLREIRRRTQLDLGIVSELTAAWLRILDSGDVALNVLWVSVSDRAGISEEEFAAAMEGEQLEAGCDAAIIALRNFTPPRMRGLFDKGPLFIHQNYKEVIQMSERVIEAATKKATEEAISRLGMQPQSVQESSDTSTSTGP